MPDENKESSKSLQPSTQEKIARFIAKAKVETDHRNQMADRQEKVQTGSTGEDGE